VAFATRGDRRLHYEVEPAAEASAPAVVLIPGIGSGMRLFGTLPRRFARHGYRCVTFDPVGIAPSSPHASATYDFAAAADDLWAVLDAAGCAGAHLVGTSLGGKVALTAAAGAPQRARSLVLLASAMVVPPRARSIYRFFATVAEKLDGDDFGTVIAPFLLGSTFHASKPQLVADIVRAVRPDPEVRRLMRAQAIALQDFAGPALAPQFVGPVLCVAGQEDTLTLPVEVRATAALWPSARYLEIEGAGHSLLLESPQTFAEVLRFVGAVDQRGPD
jgi:pimeloyl-ACP methyl ester carboxylesterase